MPVALTDLVRGFLASPCEVVVPSRLTGFAAAVGRTIVAIVLDLVTVGLGGGLFSLTGFPLMLNVLLAFFSLSVIPLELVCGGMLSLFVTLPLSLCMIMLVVVIDLCIVNFGLGRRDSICYAQLMS
ncbi:hypothetical protein KM043_009007 [Ampulex compressa]|nr:hypothetical protein KM043_009007 [Ampulex compressa]